MNDNLTLRVIDIVDGTIVDGTGLRTSVYLAGCRHKCPGCHNPQTWDFSAGYNMTIDELAHHVKRNGFNVTFTGGDPLFQPLALANAAKRLKEMGVNLWCYTGFTFEQILLDPVLCNAIADIDVLVDGPFVMEQRDISLRFRGSSNQRIIDVAKSLDERVAHIIIL